MTEEVPLTPEHLYSLGLSAAPLDALAYCLRHGLRHYLLLASGLTQQCFASVKARHLRLEEDPETGEEWLVLDITLQEEVEDVLSHCDASTDRWVAQVPWPERDSIQLAYDVI